MASSALLAGMVLLAALMLLAARDHQSGGQPAAVLPAVFESFVLAYGGQVAENSRQSQLAVINPRQALRDPAGSGVFLDPLVQVISIKPGDFGQLA
ncbi:MAG: hypothetical protein ACXIT4_11730 [Erythrobacter sp.]